MNKETNGKRGTFRSKEEFKKTFEKVLMNLFGRTSIGSTSYERYVALTYLINNEIVDIKNRNDKYMLESNSKKCIYFSMEFLIGRLTTSNLYNLGFYNVVKSAFIDLGIDINEVEDCESDAGLGNGGLGRLAACFLDSSASLGLPLYGNSIRYSKGFFVQKIINNKQVEFAENWLDKPFVWEERIDMDSIDISFFGQVEDNVLKRETWVKAVPYDVLIFGNRNNVVNKLRLWKSEVSELQENIDDSYIRETSQISNQLYPDDSTDYGKLLRLKQEYFFSSAGIKNVIREHKRLKRDLKDLPQYYVFQINDTHPVLIILELLRILIDEEGFSFDDALEIVNKTCAYTNHTILSEALEKWEIRLFSLLLPRIYEIVLELNSRLNEVISSDSRFNDDERYKLQIITKKNVRMANIAIACSFSVNGVAKLHTNILKEKELREFNILYPNKFNNKTNGITHRRWIILANGELVNLIDKYIGPEWKDDYSKIEKILEFKEDNKFLYQLSEVKRGKKIALAKVIKEKEGVELDVDSIFDVQVKRLHEYKRQLLNILHIIYLYKKLKDDPLFRENFYPHSFIFGAKAAPSYYIAKKIIQLINSVASKINDDPVTKKYLKVVFIENYNVSYAELLVPAADISEQISTATKEASGTGNMKFMANGALTIGTLDGANVEIAEQVGQNNIFLFGLLSKEVEELYESNSYHPYELYNQDDRIKDAIDSFETITSNNIEFIDLKENLLNRDYFLVLKDFDSYVNAHERANILYKNKTLWFSKVVTNIGKSAFFSSDRTISEYNKDIWNLTPKEINKG
ncbi:MAG: glycogen/starch/alpha-glucan family phosphorylase [Acholeplasmatales bacterium]|jgi:starch phosphorylase|nr:glycogen/starch/alpha-glucan family phosphorylase [Acholeplasmatales bacterium]